MTLEQGPSLVNRDKQSRRFIVEFNVRGRDVISTVEEARAAVEARVRLPPGYRLEWGGQFHNYATARARLSLVVPLALGLVLFLLWLAFGDIKPALLVFPTCPSRRWAASWRSGCATSRSASRPASASSPCSASLC